ESPKGKVALAMEGGAWKLTAPMALKADEASVNDLLWKVRDLKAKDFVADDQKSLDRYGLDHTQVRRSVWEKDVKDPKVLMLAAIKDKDQAYATTSSGGPVVLVDDKALVDLSRSPQELRDHSLLATFDPLDVAKVSIQRKDQMLVLERKGE